MSLNSPQEPQWACLNISGGEVRHDHDFLLAVKSANFVVKFTQRGTSTVNAGGGSGVKHRGQWKEDGCFPGLRGKRTPNLPLEGSDSARYRCQPMLVSKVWPDKRHRMGVLASSTSRTKDSLVILFLFQPAESGRKWHKSHLWYS